MKLWYAPLAGWLFAVVMSATFTNALHVRGWYIGEAAILVLMLALSYFLRKF